jgi:hypothetical protein
MQTASKAKTKADPLARENKGPRWGNDNVGLVFISSLCTAALHCKNALRPFLNEDDDEHQHTYFGQHSACHAF